MADFVFKRRQRPIRFTWELDRNGCFRNLSKEFGEILGPQASGLIGLPFDVVRKKFKIGKVPVISKAIKKQRAFTGATIFWPVCNSAKVVPLDLSAQPIETKHGDYDGLRGFGVIRSVDAKKSNEDVDPIAVIAKIRSNMEVDAGPAEEETSSATPVLPPAKLAAEPQEGLSLEHDQPERFHQSDVSPLEDLTIETNGSPEEDLEEDGVTAPGFLQMEPEVPELIIDFNEENDEEEDEEATSPADSEAQVGEEPAAEVEHSAVETDTSDALSLEGGSESGKAGGSESSTIDAPLVFDAGSSETAEEPAEDDEGTLQLTDADIASDKDDPLEIAVSTESAEEQASIEETTPEVVEETTEAFAEAAEEDLQAFEDDLSTPLEDTVANEVVEAPEPDFPSETTSKEDFARAIASLPDAPKKQRKSGPRSLAELTSSIVRLVDKNPVSRENTRLSKPERDAFDKIAKALGAEQQEESKAEPPPQPEKQEASSPVTPEVAAAIAVAETEGPEESSSHAENIIPLPAEPVAREVNSEVEPKEDNVTHVVLPRVPPDIEEAAERAREKKGRIPDKPIVAPIDPRLLDRLPIGVAVVRDRDVVYANDTLLELLGYERFEGLNEAGGLEAIFAEPEECPAPSPQTVDRIVHVRLATGGVLSVDARMHAVPWNGAQALMISVVEKMPSTPEVPVIPAAPSIDAQASNPQLQQAQSRIKELESVLATATDGVLVVDQKGIIRSANHSAEALFNAEEDDLLGAPITQFLVEESHVAALDYLDGLVANGVSSVLNDGREVICQTLDGDIFPTFLSMGRVSSSNENLFCAVLRDITQFKRAEEELVNARLKAEEANAHKSEYLTKISHEIRSPLNAVIGFSEVMQEERFGELGNVRYKEYARDIYRSCSHMLALINDLLDLAKIEAGKMDLTFEAVSTADIVNECIALLQPQANDQRVIIRASTPLSVPKVVADPKSLRQITINLLSNAIKFNKSGGQVIVSLISDNTGEVHLRVRDTGQGMSKDDLEAAMQPFRRLNASASTEGSGLGLPLTKALVEANRASFSINSEEDEGTLAEVTFPPQRVLAE